VCVFVCVCMCMRVYACVHEQESVCACVYMCVNVYVCSCVKGYIEGSPPQVVIDGEGVYMYVCVHARVGVCACACVEGGREWDRERENVCECMFLCVCVPEYQA